MSISINGSTGISGVNGSAAAPAIKGEDGDSGIFFGSDEAAITTGGTQRLTIDSTGAATFSSTVKTSKIENASTANGGVAIDSDGHVQVDGQQIPTVGPFSNRNMIINGGMVIAQRGTSDTAQHNDNTRSADRFLVACPNTSAVLAHSVETTGAPDGFTHWLKVSPSTADTSIGANDYAVVGQGIEGYNFARARYGFSDAKAVTVSFQFKTNKAGTYCMIHRNQAADRNFLYEFTPTADGSWQTISYTVPGDTTGTWKNDNTLGWRWEFCMANGSSLQGSTVGSWFSGQYFHSTANQVNFLDSTSNELGITGVQVELGEKATPFEYRSYGDELAMCQRYYYVHAKGGFQSYATGCYYNTTLVACHIQFPTNMRAFPTLDHTSGTGYYVSYSNSTADAFDDMNITRQFYTGTALDASGTGAVGTQGHGAVLATNNADALIAFESEL